MAGLITFLFLFKSQTQAYQSLVWPIPTPIGDARVIEEIQRDLTKKLQKNWAGAMTTVWARRTLEPPLNQRSRLKRFREPKFVEIF
ncbi:hypothetical protein MTR_4g110010 [Medicago truncatula]|uniref:Transmembrane protein n=1 Tax=Medicago truncatula TaxID=3880 RepID=A0A072UQF0_MEDTR|nr:hypothetical protein MTR_4g110010 [Medicago truncatula]